MAKQNCAICGAEIGLISAQKLADGNFICRKVCSKKTFKIFDKVEATLGDVTAHIEQVEQGPFSRAQARLRKGSKRFCHTSQKESR